ncbi:MAG TPA: ATP-binding cassette domain-containing protein [Polyangiaceae bacterium]|nr:ATP-binding cassette domain-containing protein [Polyangiaceae bacterium]
MTTSSHEALEPGIAMVGVSYGYGAVTVLNDADFELARGDTSVITGRNGSGKSTFLYLCAGLVGPRQGAVLLSGQRADAKHPSDLFRLGIRRGFVFQEGGLLSNVSALANVELPLLYHADALRLSPDEVKREAVAALERVHFNPSDFDSLPAHLSFGNRKRLALARALATRPTFFFFDDPDIGLDPKTADLIHEILCQHRDDPGVTMLVATNRELLIERLGTRGYVLQDGKIQLRNAGSSHVDRPVA